MGPHSTWSSRQIELLSVSHKCRQQLTFLPLLRLFSLPAVSFSLFCLATSAHPAKLRYSSFPPNHLPRPLRSSMPPAFPAHSLSHQNSRSPSSAPALTSSPHFSVLSYSGCVLVESRHFGLFWFWSWTVLCRQLELKMSLLNK